MYRQPTSTEDLLTVHFEPAERENARSFIR